MLNFLADYRLFTEGDEVPENYRIWSGLATLASILGRRVWVDWGRFRIYPNLYIVLLGPPGNGKTTAMSTSKQLIRELSCIPFSAECQTKESLCKELVGYERAFEVHGKSFVYTPISIFVTELSHFLGPNSGHMIDFLTTIFDQDVYDNKTKGKGSELIIGPCVNLLACTTPQWITTYLRSDIISGGFTRRVLFINEDETSQREPFPELTANQRVARERILGIARGLLKLSGPFQWLGEAREFFADWYKSLLLPDDPHTRWYHRTKHIQIMKAMMSVSASRGFDLTITPEDILITLEIFDKFERNLARVFQGMGRNEMHAITQKAIEMLRAAGGRMPERQFDIVMNRDANPHETFQMKEFLQRTGQVKFAETKTNGVIHRVILLEQALYSGDVILTRSSPLPADALERDLTKVTCQPSQLSETPSDSSTE